MKNVDFGRHSDDYARYRRGFPGSVYERLESLMHLQGARALDLATCPGVIALELGKRGSVLALVRPAKSDGRGAARPSTGWPAHCRALFLTGGALRGCSKHREARFEVQSVLDHGGLVRHVSGRNRPSHQGGLTPEAVVAFDEALESMLRRAFPEPLVVEHRVWSVVVRKLS